MLGRFKAGIDLETIYDDPGQLQLPRVLLLSSYLEPTRTIKLERLGFWYNHACY